MNCPNCGSQMTGGAPHCETIKVQMECHNCGHYENEYYTPEEMAAIELAQIGYNYQDAKKAVADAHGDIHEAERILKRSRRIICV